MLAAGLLLALVLLAVTGGCGGNSPLASLTPTIGTAAPPPPEPEPMTSAEAAAIANYRSGVMVVAVGKVTLTTGDGGPVYTEGGDTVLAARSLAKLIYKRSKLRPDTTEDVVQVLAGDPPPAGSPPSLKELADLRAGLGEDVEGAASKALLLALTDKVKARAFVLVSSVPEKAPTARLVRVDDVEGGPPIARPSAAIFTSIPPTEPGADYAWPNVDDAVGALLGPEVPQPLAPTKAAIAASKAPKTGAVVPKKDESKPITEKPWFWVIIGGVAALGVTAVVVSQTVNTSTGTVHVQGKVAH